MQQQAEGWSTYQMQERMGMLFQQWANGDLSPPDFAWMTDRMPPYRRELIARTETTQMQGAGTQQLFMEWNIENKEWFSTPDDRCRDTHTAANGQTGIGVQGSFYDHVHLEWVNVANEGGYLLETSSDNTTFTPLAQLGPNITHYDMTGVTIEGLNLMPMRRSASLQRPSQFGNLH